jgi:imidazoleglycerol-phosphate dehydratase/histidinol-phosphatase
MKIWIETSALAGKSNQMLWSGALFGLNYLRRFDHFYSFKVDDLSERLKNLLHNEQITSESFGKEEAGLRVESQDKNLQLVQEGAEPQLFDDWIELSEAVCFPHRTAQHRRATAETEIEIDINLDGTGEYSIETGLGFLDHMLQQIAKHGLIDLSLKCQGDLEVDEHHTIEDVAIALGTAISEALGTKTGISRYGFALPMDESAATVLLDLSGRPFLVFQGDFDREMVGDFPAEMAEHFFYSLAINLKATLHILVEGKNDHHKLEACFKGFARCLRAAVSRSERNLNILPSTKDIL